jgi:hypothetical protein
MIKNFKKTNILFTVIIIIITFLGVNKISFASTEIYFQKDVKEINKGDIFSVNLKISSDKMVNVIDGTLTYDKNILEIKKIKTDNSLLSLWVKEPIFNNEIGELSFVGGVPNGFKGKDGQILEITFFTKKEGLTIVGFKDIFSVFINDGLGTQINPWLKPLSLSISKRQNIFINNISSYILPINMNTNYKYYIGVFVLILLFIIIKLLIKFKKNDK